VNAPTTTDTDELDVLAAATRAPDLVEIAHDSLAAGKITLRTYLELVAEAGLLAAHAQGADYAWLDERKAA
jgi:hypothetical protein